MTALEVTDLTVAFGRRAPVVKGISLAIPAGGRLGLIGESGSGKSVTALAVMGLLDERAHTAGTITVAGQPVLGRGDRELSRLRGDTMSMVFQEPMTALDPTMRVGRQVAEVLRLHAGLDHAASRPRVLEILTEVGLPAAERIADAYPHQLSGGQRQRVVLAMALVNTPALVICDEPTTALDVTVQARVLDVLDRELVQRGAACLFISHDLAVVARICTHLAVLLDGEIVETGALRTVLAEPQHPYTQGLVAAARIDDIAPGQRLPVMSDFHTGES
ncbi:MAG: ABC transporter ATP-binding protein [Propionibacteriales bacterium]|nr:ABC transporter ATP-binding protein [Propionibacteriales bacterium]